MIELYGMGSPNVLKVAIMLEELELPYRFRRVEVFRSGQFDPAFLALNPNGKVPVIVDPGTAGTAPTTVFESGAILIHLAERERRLLPETGKARTEVLQWLMLQIANIGPLIGQLNHFRFAARDGNDYAFERYRRETGRLFRLLDRRLAASPFLGGDDYSIADVATYPWSLYLERHGFAAREFGALDAWRGIIAARPAVVRARAAMAEIEAADAVALKTAPAEHLDRFFGRAGAPS